MEESRIDKYFKDELGPHQEAPPGEVWERIEAALDEEGDDKGAIIHWRGIAALSLFALLLVSSIFWWRMDKLDRERLQLQKELVKRGSKHEAPMSSDENYVTQKEKLKHSVDNQGLGLREEDKLFAAEEDLKSESRLESFPSTEIAKRNQQVISPEQPWDSKGDSEVVIIREREQLEENGYIYSDVVLELEREGFSEHSDMAIKPYLPLSIGHVERAIYYPPGIDVLLCGGLRKAWPSRWSIGLNIFQNNTFRRIQAVNSEGRQIKRFLDRAEEAGSSYGANIFAAYRLGKRTSISLGADYSQWRQSGSYTIAYSGDIGDVSTGIAALSYTQQTEVLTSTGIDDVLLQAEFALGEPLPWAEGFGQDGEATTAVSIEEQIQWLSIPVTLRYRLIGKRLGLQASAGLAYDMILKNRVDIELEGRFADSQTNSAAFTKRSYVSAQGGMSAFYRLSERSTVSAGPRYKTWLVPLSEASSHKSFPYSTSIDIGLEIDLYTTRGSERKGALTKAVDY